MGFKWYKLKNDVGISIGDTTVKCGDYRVQVEWVRARGGDQSDEVIYSVNIWVKIDPDPGDDIYDIVFNGIGDFMNEHLSECDRCSCGNPCKKFLKRLNPLIKNLLKDALKG